MTRAPFLPIERLGRGAMAEVVRADLRVPGGGVVRAAVKRILPSLCRDPEIRRRFEEEADISARLAHPNIPRVLGADVDADEPWIAFELIEGPTLDEVLEALGGGPASVDVAATVGAQVASALGHAHSQPAVGEGSRRGGIVHRDVAPSNVLVHEDGTVRLIDFGIARGARSRRTRSGAVIGHAAWLSPEQSRGEPADARSDVFSCALLVYALSTGVHPFAHDDMFESLALADACRIDIRRAPRRLQRVLGRALARVPRDRYRDGNELEAALSRAAPAKDGTRALRSLVAAHFDTEGGSDGATLPAGEVDATLSQVEPPDPDTSC